MGFVADAVLLEYRLIEMTPMNTFPFVWVIMGVAGSGKTLIGRRWAERLDCDFLEGDRRHAPPNILKMRAQVPLDDGDRQQWLQDIESDIHGAIHHQREVVLTCSALKASYRSQMTALGRVQLVWLKVSKLELVRRLSQRSHHYMKPEMLDSQLAAFETIRPDENVITLDGEHPPDQIMDRLWAIALERFPALQTEWWQRLEDDIPT